MHCITLRLVAVQCVLAIAPMSYSPLVFAEPTAAPEPTSTLHLTSTSVRTIWVVVTSNSNTVTTFSTATIVDGSTLGIQTVIGSTVTDSPAEATAILRPLDSSSSPSDSDSGDMAWQGQSFQDAVLNSTNYYRAQHQASPLAWSESLASYAQDQAQKCVFEHSGGPHGENLAENFVSPTLAIDAWAGEESKYNYKKEQFSEAAGHYTQVVWKNTTTVGCGAVNCSNSDSNGANGYYLVCEYDPPGNVIGQFGGNVGKAGESKNGEPGMGAAGRVGGTGGKLLFALVATAVFAGLCF